jgi:hypothetical protein
MPEDHLSIVVVLTDWPELTVKALRFFTVSPFFTEKLIEALLGTASAYTREGYEQGVQRCFSATRCMPLVMAAGPGVSLVIERFAVLAWWR